MGWIVKMTIEIVTINYLQVEFSEHLTLLESIAFKLDRPKLFGIYREFTIYAIYWNGRLY